MDRTDAGALRQTTTELQANYTASGTSSGSVTVVNPNPGSSVSATANVQFTVYKGANHTEAALPFEGASSQFLQGRFAGTPFVNGCSSIGKGNSLKPLPVHKHHKK